MPPIIRESTIGGMAVIVDRHWSLMQLPSSSATTKLLAYLNPVKLASQSPRSWKMSRHHRHQDTESHRANRWRLCSHGWI